MSFALVSEGFCKEVEDLLSSPYMQIFLGSRNYHVMKHLFVIS